MCDSPARAIEIAGTHSLSLAILDVVVGDENSFSVADALARTGVPYFFATATAREHIDERHRDRPVLSKPFSDDQLLELVSFTIAAREPA